MYVHARTHAHTSTPAQTSSDRCDRKSDGARWPTLLTSESSGSSTDAKLGAGLRGFGAVLVIAAVRTVQLAATHSCVRACVRAVRLADGQLQQVHLSYRPGQPHCMTCPAPCGWPEDSERHICVALPDRAAARAVSCTASILVVGSNDRNV